MDKKKLQILVCCHKIDSMIRTESPYLPIQVGKALHPELDLGFQNDNEGDNISEKNSQWCELTALYWGWKNIKNVEYLGLCHYRRYFDYDFTDDNIEKLLRSKDIILLEKSVERCSVATRFMELVSMEDFYIYLDTLLKIYPEYLDAILKYCFNSNQFVRCTMFVAPKKIYDDFCETFFPVFEEVEKRIRPHGYSRINRCIAYLGELSLGIYVTHKNFNIKYFDEYPFNDIPCGIWLLKKFKRAINNRRRKLGFLILNTHKKNKDLLYAAVIQGFRNDEISVKVLENTMLGKV